MKVFRAFLSLMLILGLGMFSLPVQADKKTDETPVPGPSVEITAKALEDHEEDPTVWHFVINQLDSDDLAPSPITVKWANGSSAEVPLDKITGGVAHYSTTNNLDSSVTGASTNIYSEWSGQFNLSHGPKCPVPPTAVPPTDVPPTTVPPTDIPPTEVVKTETPPTGVPPTEVGKTETPTGEPPTEVAKTGTPTVASKTDTPPTKTEPPGDGKDPTKTPVPTQALIIPVTGAGDGWPFSKSLGLSFMGLSIIGLVLTTKRVI